MKVEVVSLVEGAREAKGVGILIDVFRSSNTMLVLASRGSRIIQAATVEKALVLKSQNPQWLLFGEVDGFPPEGFDHGNSPVEAGNVDLTDTVILCTSAGSAAIYAMQDTEEILITSFANITKVINHIAKNMPQNVTLVAVGKEGIMDYVVQRVRESSSNPCPPIIVGVGIGGTFEKAAILAKKALLRPLGSQQPDPEVAEMEAELLRRIKDLGIGPQGYGGKTTALGVHIEMMPCHIASLPVGVNIQCHASRHKEAVI